MERVPYVLILLNTLGLLILVRVIFSEQKLSLVLKMGMSFKTSDSSSYTSLQLVAMK